MRKTSLLRGQFSCHSTKEDTFQGGKAGLIEAFKAAFVDVLNPLHSRLILQIQDHNWGGAYIDLLDQDIPDRSYVNVIAEVDAAKKHDASSQVSL